MKDDSLLEYNSNIIYNSLLKVNVMSIDESIPLHNSLRYEIKLYDMTEDINSLLYINSQLTKNIMYKLSHEVKTNCIGQENILTYILDYIKKSSESSVLTDKINKNLIKIDTFRMIIVNLMHHMNDFMDEFRNLSNNKHRIDLIDEIVWIFQYTKLLLYSMNKFSIKVNIYIDNDILCNEIISERERFRIILSEIVKNSVKNIVKGEINIRLGYLYMNNKIKSSKNVFRLKSNIIFNKKERLTKHYSSENKRDSYESNGEKEKILCLFVSDSGKGMSKETLNHIKDNCQLSIRQYLLRNSSTFVKTGRLGIGFLTIKEYSKHLNLNIDIFSKINEGTSILIKIDKSLYAKSRSLSFNDVILKKKIQEEGNEVRKYKYKTENKLFSLKNKIYNDDDYDYDDNNDEFISQMNVNSINTNIPFRIEDDFPLDSNKNMSKMSFYSSFFNTYNNISTRINSHNTNNFKLLIEETVTPLTGLSTDILNYEDMNLIEDLKNKKRLSIKDKLYLITEKYRSNQSLSTSKNWFMSNMSNQVYENVKYISEEEEYERNKVGFDYENESKAKETCDLLNKYSFFNQESSESSESIEFNEEIKSNIDSNHENNESSNDNIVTERINYNEISFKLDLSILKRENIDKEKDKDKEKENEDNNIIYIDNTNEEEEENQKNKSKMNNLKEILDSITKERSLNRSNKCNTHDINTNKISNSSIKNKKVSFYDQENINNYNDIDYKYSLNSKLNVNNTDSLDLFSKFNINFNRKSNKTVVKTYKTSLKSKFLRRYKKFSLSKTCHETNNGNNNESKVNELAVLIKKEVILCVDDDYNCINSLKNLCQKVIKELNLNIEIVGISDGLETISFIIKSIKDNIIIRLIITDENMEYMNGSNSLYIIREIYSLVNKRSNIHIELPEFVILTALEGNHMSNELINKSKSMMILKKPINKSILFECFEKAKLC